MAKKYKYHFPNYPRPRYAVRRGRGILWLRTLSDAEADLLVVLVLLTVLAAVLWAWLVTHWRR